MMEFAYLCTRWAHHLSALIAFGCLGFILLAGYAGNSALAQWKRNALRMTLLVAVIAFGSGILVLFAQLASLPDSELPLTQVLERLLGKSRFGLVWQLREAFLLAATIFCAAASRRPSNNMAVAWSWLAWLCTGASLTAAPFSGHSAAADPAWPALSAHIVHLLAVGAWLGALPLVTSISRYAEINERARAAALTVLRRFSALALPMMLLIVASGTWIGVVHVENFPALLGTRYGYILIVKIIVLGVVLVLASQLRWHLLPKLDAGFRSGKAFSSWVRTEWMIALCIAALAVWLAQTIPAKHDDIAWRLPFRVSIEASWDTKWMTEISLSALAVALLGSATMFVALLRRPRSRIQGIFGAALLAAGTISGLWAISVEAYPGTYWQPSIPYQTISVAAGAALFQQHCVTCHGRSGHGDGPAAASLPAPPADLTEPHTAYHTAGDIFWWLTYGKPPGIMPGFAQVLSEDDRWDVINYLRVLSAGYQARIISESIVPERPWLGAVDFNYTDQSGRFATLKDHREQDVVLLVLFSPTKSAQRMEQLAQYNTRIEAAGAVTLAVPTAETEHSQTSWPFRVVDEGAREVVVTYSLMRRSLVDADARDERLVPEHMELLIDRYGYVRARWLPGQNEAWNDIDRLLAEISALAQEPQILDPPDDHVH